MCVRMCVKMCVNVCEIAVEFDGGFCVSQMNFAFHFHSFPFVGVVLSAL